MRFKPTVAIAGHPFAIRIEIAMLHLTSGCGASRRMRRNETGAGMKSEIDATAELAILPFKLIEESDFPCGYERSFKLLEGKVLANRYLLGIDIKDDRRARLLEICREMGMPDSHAGNFEANLAEANLVFLGFEDNETSCIYKIYLEYWEKAKKDLAASENKKEPTLLYQGYKWEIGNDKKSHRELYVASDALGR